jgi:hypothetical protein
MNKPFHYFFIFDRQKSTPSQGFTARSRAGAMMDDHTLLRPALVCARRHAFQAECTADRVRCLWSI